MKKRLSYPKLLALGFLTVIAVGTLLLWLPFSARDGATTLWDALFTATSATCVTGLVPFDTFSHWTGFGQLFILLLIQIGGLGFMTFISVFILFRRHKISLHEQRWMMESSGAGARAEVKQMVRQIVNGTLLFEGIGAVILALRFCPEMGIWRGIYNSIFHSVSAFCNAGFDLMGRTSPLSSFTGYAGDPIVTGTLMMLIIIGGIGFPVWHDILQNGLRLRRYRLHSKIVLSATAVLLVGGTVFFWCSEQSLLADLPTGQRLLCAVFQAVTPRTAGFNTINQANLSTAGYLGTLFLMLIGGASGSTAGGIKINTLAVLWIASMSVIRHRSNITVFKRRLHDSVLKQAVAVTVLYLTVLTVAICVLGTLEPIGLKAIVYEAVSAIATVGMSMGITAKLSIASKLVIALLMYFGRIGGLSLAMAFSEESDNLPISRPPEKIMIG